MACLGFDSLLQRVAVEHAREVYELRAEIARLRGARPSDGSSYPPGADSLTSPWERQPQQQLLVQRAAEDLHFGQPTVYARGEASPISSQWTNSPSGLRTSTGRAASHSTSAAAASARAEPEPEASSRRSVGLPAAVTGQHSPVPQVVPPLALPMAPTALKGCQDEQARLLGEGDEQWGSLPDAGALASVLSAVPYFQESDEDAVQAPRPAPRPVGAPPQRGVAPLSARQPCMSSRPMTPSDKPTGRATLPESPQSARAMPTKLTQVVCVMDEAPVHDGLDAGVIKVPAEQPKSPRPPSEAAEPRTPRLSMMEMRNWQSLLSAIGDKLCADGLPKMHASWNVENGTLSRAVLKGVLDQKKQQLSRDASTTLMGPARGRCLAFKVEAIHPNNRYRVAWDILGVVILAHDLVMIPIITCFETDTVSLGSSYNSFKKHADVVSATFWTADILVSFMTGYHNNGGLVVRSIPQVARNYARGWFPIDVSIVTVDWLQLVINVSSSSQYMTSVQQLGKTVAKILRVGRLFRFMKMNKNVSELLETINSEYVLTAAHLLKHLFTIVLINHYIACFWYGLSRVSRNLPNGSWMQFYLVDRGNGEDVWLSYATSLHWSLTQFTPASMEIFPRNVCERFFNVGIIVLALLVFSSFVSSITNAMNHIRNINAKCVEQETKIRRYFKENGIHHDLASRVWHFVRRNRIVAARRLRLDEVSALKQLPIRLKDELHQEVYLPILGHHAFFKVYNIISAAVVRKMCKTAVQESALAAGYPLFDSKTKKGAVPGGGKETYMVRKMVFTIFGSLEYHESEELVCTIEAGQWACEAALWLDTAALDGPLSAGNAGCDAMMVDADGFRAVAKDDIENIHTVAKYASLFVARFVEASQSEEQDEDQNESVFMNDPEAVESLVREAFQSASHAESLAKALGAKRMFRPSVTSRSSQITPQSFPRP